MLLPEFESEFKRLRLTYGDKSFPSEREKLFFDRFKRMSIFAFREAVDHVILTMPIPSLVLGVIDESAARGKAKNRSEYGGGFKELPTNFKCDPCRDFGYGWIGETIVRCVCEEGSKVSDAEIARQQKNYEAGKKMMLAGKGVFAIIGKQPATKGA